MSYSADLLQAMIDEGLAGNRNHARRVLYVLKCHRLETDQAILARCRRYKRWKDAGRGTGVRIDKELCREKAIAGEEPNQP